MGKEGEEKVLNMGNGARKTVLIMTPCVERCQINNVCEKRAYGYRGGGGARAGYRWAKGERNGDICLKKGGG